MTVETNLPTIAITEPILLLVFTKLSNLQRNEEEKRRGAAIAVLLEQKKMERSSKCHDFDFGMAPMIDWKAWVVQGI